MYCAKCGKVVKEDWKVCPNCGYGIFFNNEVKQEQKKVAKEEKAVKKNKDDDLDWNMFKTLFKSHPVRFMLCSPLAIYTMYRFYPILGMDLDHFGLILLELLKVGALSSFTILGMWLIYGPINYKEVKERVKGIKIEGIGLKSWIISIVGALVLMWFIGLFEPVDTTVVSANVEQTQSSTTYDISSAKEDMSVEEYVNSCIPVTKEDIARNPEEYIGKAIIIEGNLSTVVDNIVIGLWNGYPISVNYDGKAYDKEGTIIGDVMDGDYGYVVGVFKGDDYTGNPYIDAVIIILETSNH